MQKMSIHNDIERDKEIIKYRKTRKNKAIRLAILLNDKWRGGIF